MLTQSVKHSCPNTNTQITVAPVSWDSTPSVEEGKKEGYTLGLFFMRCWILAAIPLFHLSKKRI